ncbi:MAG TPA: PKD domain-containing protein, partial [Candidatus Dormibacteraeota bacterium]|nr:PKD domain-containing protein [Candidatus Dormibacteraeota bacterium]
LLAMGGTASASSCAQSLLDSQGYTYDTVAPPLAPTRDHTFATLHDGGNAISSNAWDDWGALFVGGTDLAHLYFSSDNTDCAVGSGGQQLVFPTIPIGGLQVQRKLFVSSTGLPGARLLELVTNPGPASVITSVQVGDNQSANQAGDLGSDAATAVRSTSNGNATLGAEDLWGVTSDHAGGATNVTPALAHVFDGPGGASHVSSITLSGSDAVPQDNLVYRWSSVLIPPHSTAAFLSYEIQQTAPDRSAATEDAAARGVALAYHGLPLTQVYAGMSDTEIAAVRNWPKPSPVAAIIARNGSDIKDVTLAAGGAPSTAAGVCQGASYAWNFDDGGFAVGQTVTHRFAAGKHTATLTVTNSCGVSAFNQKTISIANAPPVVRVLLPKSITLRQLITSRLVFAATSNENASASISGSIPKSVARKSTRVKISPKITSARLRLAAGTPGTVRLRPSSRAKRALKILRKKGFKLTVIASVRDDAGKVTKVRRAVRIR